MGGRFFFLRNPRIGSRNRARSHRKTLKENKAVSNKTETNRVAAKAAGLGISLDSWAVALALGLALLVWSGWIKQVPW